MKLAAFTVLIGAFILLGGAAQADASACHASGHAPFTRPDGDCTPGSYAYLTKTEVCTPKDRPSLPAAVRWRIVTRYGVPGWSGVNGELDHRVPLFLGGRTNSGNIWPEAGSIPNLKDRLESYVWLRICVRGTMSVRYARHVFLGDWVAYWRRYFGAEAKPISVERQMA